MRGVEDCDCGHESSDPFYLMQPNADKPDEVRAVLCQDCTGEIADDPEQFDDEKLSPESTLTPRLGFWEKGDDEGHSPDKDHHDFAREAGRDIGPDDLEQRIAENMGEPITILCSRRGCDAAAEIGPRLGPSYCSNECAQEAWDELREENPFDLNLPKYPPFKEPDVSTAPSMEWICHVDIESWLLRDTDVVHGPFRSLF